MNNPNNMLIIESRSNYAFQLRGKNLSFSEIRNTSTAFFTSLPEDVRNELYNNMCHGTVKLDCEPELNAYMYAFGAMHNAKLRDAFSHLSTHFFDEKEIDIIDYGCGQAMGCISYADYLKENNHTQNVRRITLIEPSYIALARAALHSSLLFPNAEIITINKGFDDLTVSDIEVDTNIPTLHIFSNVLDMGSTPNYNGVFNLETFSNLVLEISKGYNEYVITEPLFSDSRRDEQVDIFIRSLGLNVYYEKKCNTGEFFTGKDWTCVVKCGHVGLSDTHKEYWTWREFRNLYGKPKLGTFVKSNGETFKRVVFIDESNDANKVFVRFSKLHRELSSEIIIKNRDNIVIYQCNDSDGEKYYELELRHPSLSENGDSISLAQFILMYGKPQLARYSNKNTNRESTLVVYLDESNESNRVFLRISNYDKTLFNNTISKNLDKIKIYYRIDSTGDKYFELILNAYFVPSNEIWYETTDNKILEFVDGPTDRFGANIVSNTYDRGFGILKFDGALAVINHLAFAKCLNLRYLHLPQSVTKLGDGIFGGCSSLERFVIPNNVTKIPNFAFEGCCNLKNVYLHNNIIEIGTRAFAHCTSLVNIKIPESVAIIKDSAFCYCVNITEMEIPQNVTSIGFGILEDCSNIKKFYGKFASDDGLCLIYKGRLLSFANGCGITEYILPNSVVKIDYKAFLGCDTLTQLTISDGVVEIGEYAFLKCINLSRIKILGDIKTIKPNAFWDCDKITAFSGGIASSDGLCLIVNNELVAFARGCNMAHYTIPNEVIKIAPFVFRNCKYLQTIDIPDGVMTIEYCNFIQCPRLEKFYGKFASDDGLCVICGNKLIAYASNCGHKKYIIPNNVTEICDGAFYNCHNIIEIHIPNTVTKIGGQVWGNCTSLQSITFPENVYLIKNKCFIGCEDLTSIYFKSVVPPTDDLRCIGQPNFFDTKKNDVTFYVSQNVVNKYKAYWPQYADKIVGYDYE